MEKKFLITGIVIVGGGALLYLIGSVQAGTLVMAMGALDLSIVIFWHSLTKRPASRGEYTVGNKIVDASLIWAGVILPFVTGMFIFLALTLWGLAALLVRYQEVERSH